MNAAKPALLRVALTCFRALLLLYPRAFRAEYGAEMMQVFCTTYITTYRRTRLTGTLRLGIVTAWDMVINACSERLREEFSMSLRTASCVIAVFIWVFTAYWLMVAGIIYSATIFHTGIPDQLYLSNSIYYYTQPLFVLLYLGAYICLYARQISSPSWDSWLAFGLAALAILANCGAQIWNATFFIGLHRSPSDLSPGGFLNQFINLSWIVANIALVVWGILCLWHKTLPMWITLVVAALGINQGSQTLELVLNPRIHHLIFTVILITVVSPFTQYILITLLGVALYRTWDARVVHPSTIGATPSLQDASE